jgi:DNA invertase Pin-like site-specific DNA recombinase
MFGMLAVFGEFEREMIVARVNAGLARARHSGTKSSKAIGRPKGADFDRKAIRAALLKGGSVREVVRETGASIGTTAAVRRELIEAGAL